jgi:hypothetical protein
MEAALDFSLPRAAFIRIIGALGVQAQLLRIGVVAAIEELLSICAGLTCLRQAVTNCARFAVICLGLFYRREGRCIAGAVAGAAFV